MYNLVKILDKALSLCDKENIPYGEITSITVNKRLSKAWGRCIHRSGSTTYQIEVRKIIADSKTTPEKAIMEVVLHEIIHTCEGCWNHGELFKSYGSRFAKYGYNVGNAKTSVDSTEIDINTYVEKCKYAVRCPKCGFTIAKDRMCGIIKYPNFYTHTKCGETFVRFK